MLLLSQVEKLSPYLGIKSVSVVDCTSDHSQLLAVKAEREDSDQSHPAPEQKVKGPRLAIRIIRTQQHRKDNLKAASNLFISF